MGGLRVGIFFQEKLIAEAFELVDLTGHCPPASALLPTFFPAHLRQSRLVPVAESRSGETQSWSLQQEKVLIVFPWQITVEPLSWWTWLTESATDRPSQLYTASLPIQELAILYQCPSKDELTTRSTHKVQAIRSGVQPRFPAHHWLSSTQDCLKMT